jgi:hypothetical protein
VAQVSKVRRRKGVRVRGFLCLNIGGIGEGVKEVLDAIGTCVRGGPQNMEGAFGSFRMGPEGDQTAQTIGEAQVRGCKEAGATVVHCA